MAHGNSSFTETIDDVSNQRQEENSPPKPKTRKEKMALRKLEYCDPIVDNQRKLLKDVFIAEEDDTIKEERLQSIVYSILESCENPLKDILPLYECLPDHKSTKLNSLSGLVISYFKSWVIKNDLAELKDKYLTMEIRKAALTTFTRSHLTFLNLMSEIYQFDDEDMRIEQTARIKDLNTKKNFKEAMELACHYDLFHKYDIYDFIIPCFLQDKSEIVMEILKKDPKAEHLKIALIKFFDDFVNRSYSEIEKLLTPYKELRIMTLSFERFYGRSLEKLVNRILIVLKLDRSLAPNLATLRLLGSIRFNIHNRFKDDDPMSDEAYYDQMKTNIDQNKDRALPFLLDRLIRNDYLDDALRWIIVYRLSLNDFPALRNYVDNNPDIYSLAEEKVKQYQQKIEDSDLILHEGHPIIIVDTWEKMENLMEKISKTEIIGLDSENKPTVQCEGAAILQCSLGNETFLVDFITLEQLLTMEQFEKFFDTLLCGRAIKLGFDFINDMRIIFDTPPFNKISHIVERSNVLCLKRLVENILQVDETFVDFSQLSRSQDGSLTDHDIGNTDIIHFGLSTLSLLLCGKKISKAEQCSNWSARPLRKEQKRYAAMDAYILIGLFEKIKLLSIERGLVLNDFIAGATINSMKKPKIKRDKAPRVEDMNWADCVEALNSKVIGDISCPRKPGDLKCIVDMMLRGLGKNLRRIGVNVIMCDSKPHVSEQALKRPDRVIFTAGRSYDALKAQFPSRVVCIQNVACNPLTQLKKVVEKYNLVFDASSIFSRCIECNCDKFVRVPSIVLRALHYCHVICSHPFHEDPFDYEYWFTKLESASRTTVNPIPFRIDRPVENPEWLSASVEDGVVDITRNIILHREKDDGNPCLIEKVPEQVFHLIHRFFYVCSDCGKVYWDGKHKENYTEAIDEAFNNASNSPPNE